MTCQTVFATIFSDIFARATPFLSLLWASSRLPICFILFCCYSPNCFFKRAIVYSISYTFHPFNTYSQLPNDLINEINSTFTLMDHWSPLPNVQLFFLTTLSVLCKAQVRKKGNVARSVALIVTAPNLLIQPILSTFTLALIPSTLLNTRFHFCPF